MTDQARRILELEARNEALQASLAQMQRQYHRDMITVLRMARNVQYVTTPGPEGEVLIDFKKPDQ